jgi:uncharacterized protein YqjF (DUF2071 family)
MHELLDLVNAPGRQAATLDDVAHRPWPVPERPWTMGQTWDELLFAHWRVPLDSLVPLVSTKVQIEQHDGSAWIGITPFHLTGLRLRGTLPLPRVSAFLELNVRTYVTDGEKPGIWFFSLDAASRLAVEAARTTYKLPYFHARMRSAHVGDWIAFESARTDAHGVAFGARHRPRGPQFNAEPGTLEHFVAERYCLYTEDRGALQRAEIHHPPWPLQEAEAEIELNTMAPVELPDEALHLMFARRQDVVLWPLEPVR